MTTANVERLELGALTCWRLSLNGSELLITQQGAQILSYQQAGQQPIIWLSQEASYEPANSVRGGVPVCWPWFGNLQRNPPAVQGMHAQPLQAGAHGLVRSIDWALQEVDQQDNSISITFSYNSLEQPLPDWPHAAQLTLSVRLDTQLHISLECRNLGIQPLTFSQALHSYFAVSDIRQVSVKGLHDCQYIETLEDWQTRTQQGDLRFAGETDRIYLNTPPTLHICDPGWQRSIHLQSSGSNSAVLWNPWIDKAQRLSQFADSAWQRMLCIEHANVLDDAVTLAPNAQHQLGISIWAEALSS